MSDHQKTIRNVMIFVAVMAIVDVVGGMLGADDYGRKERMASAAKVVTMTGAYIALSLKAKK